VRGGDAPGNPLFKVLPLARVYKASSRNTMNKRMLTVRKKISTEFFKTCDKSPNHHEKHATSRRSSRRLRANSLSFLDCASRAYPRVRRSKFVMLIGE